MLSAQLYSSSKLAANPLPREHYSQGRATPMVHCSFSFLQNNKERNTWKKEPMKIFGASFHSSNQMETGVQSTLLPLDLTL